MGAVGPAAADGPVASVVAGGVAGESAGAAVTIAVLPAAGVAGTIRIVAVAKPTRPGNTCSATATALPSALIVAASPSGAVPPSKTDGRRSKTSCLIFAIRAVAGSTVAAAGADGSAAAGVTGVLSPAAPVATAVARWRGTAKYRVPCTGTAWPEVSAVSAVATSSAAIVARSMSVEKARPDAGLEPNNPTINAFITSPLVPFGSPWRPSSLPSIHALLRSLPHRPLRAAGSRPGVVRWRAARRAARVLRTVVALRAVSRRLATVAAAALAPLALRAFLRDR